MTTDTMATMAYYNFLIFCVYAALLALGYLVFLLGRGKRAAHAGAEAA